MSLTLYLPKDAAALALGADEVAAALTAEAAARGIEVRVVRTGSRGMIWLEPLLEIMRDGSLHGFGPPEVSDARGLLKAISRITPRRWARSGPSPSSPAGRG